MIEIEGKIIDVNSKPYIIAEMSGNHNGSIERAFQSIKVAKNCGADAVKIQTYTADTMTIDCESSDFIISGGLWNGYKLYDLYQEAHTPYEWHEELFNYARKLGITIFSSPFDETAVDLLEVLNVSAYKIASFELTDLPLLKYIAKTGKPVLMSTGMATEEEITESVEFLKAEGCKQLLLFHCVSSYPALTQHSNLRKIVKLREKYGLPVGLSDHTIDNTAAIAAIANGACAIEKHFTISRNDKGPDSEFSLEPQELELLVNESFKTWQALGDGSFNRTASELNNRIFRRSLYFVKDLKAGETIKSVHIRRIRPGYGINPKFIDSVIGKKVNRNILVGDSVTWDKIEK